MLSLRSISMPLVPAITLLMLTAACSGRTPDGKSCRRNLLPFLPSFTTDMSQTCPQDTTYYNGAGKTASGELSPEASMPATPAN